MNLALETLAWLQGVDIEALSDRVEKARAIFSTTDGQVKLCTDTHTENLGEGRGRVRVQGRGRGRVHLPHCRGHKEFVVDEIGYPEGKKILSTNHSHSSIVAPPTYIGSKLPDGT